MIHNADAEEMAAGLTYEPGISLLKDDGDADAVVTIHSLQLAQRRSRLHTQVQ